VKRRGPGEIPALSLDSADVRNSAPTILESADPGEIAPSRRRRARDRGPLLRDPPGRERLPRSRAPRRPPYLSGAMDSPAVSVPPARLGAFALEVGCATLDAPRKILAGAISGGRGNDRRPTPSPNPPPFVRPRHPTARGQEDRANEGRRRAGFPTSAKSSSATNAKPFDSLRSLRVKFLAASP